MKTSADDLKDIIKEHQDWQSFDWKPQLVFWSLILLAVSFWEWLAPGWTWLGFCLYGTGYLFQVIRDLTGTPRTPAAISVVWALGILLQAAVGIILPQTGILTPLAGVVLQNFFLALTVFILGTYKGRRSLSTGALAPVSAALLCGVFPQAQGLFPLAVLAGVVVPAVFLKTDR